MNYEPGQKVKVKVNDVEWDDEIDSEYVEQYSKNGKRINITYNQCALKSGICVPVSMLSPIEPEIKPEPGDIVAVYNEEVMGEDLRVFLRKNGKYVCRTYSDTDGEFARSWSHCRVLARKPKRWEEMSYDEKDNLTHCAHNWIDSSIDSPEEKLAYEKIVSAILGGAPYARIAE